LIGVRSIGTQVAGPLYTANGASCLPVGNYTAYAVGAEVPPETFALATARRDP
jgi:hypothetical protein